MLAGATRGSGGWGLARHLVSRKHGQVATLLDVRFLGAESVKEALDELVSGSAHGRTDEPVHHVHVDPPIGAESEALFARWHELYETEFGLENAPRITVEHVKDGRTHRHVVYSLVNDDGSVVDLHHDYARREKISRIIEHEFGLPMVAGKHNRAVVAFLRKEGRDSAADAMVAAGLTTAERPVAVTPRERHQAERTHVDPDALGRDVLSAWTSSDGVRSFRTAILQSGLRLAQGDDSDVVVVDHAGGTHSLTRLLGKHSKAAGQPRINAKDVRLRLGALDDIPALADLPPLPTRTEGVRDDKPAEAPAVESPAPASPQPVLAAVENDRGAEGERRGGQDPQEHGDGRGRRDEDAVDRRGSARPADGGAAGGPGRPIGGLATDPVVHSRPLERVRGFEPEDLRSSAQNVARALTLNQLRSVDWGDLREEAKPAAVKVLEQFDWAEEQMAFRLVKARRLPEEDLLTTVRRKALDGARDRLSRAQAAVDAIQKPEGLRRLSPFAWVKYWDDMAVAETELKEAQTHEADMTRKHEFALKASDDERRNRRDAAVTQAQAKDEGHRKLLGAARDILHENPSIARRGFHAVVEAAQKRLAEEDAQRFAPRLQHLQVLRLEDLEPSQTSTFRP